MPEPPEEVTALTRPCLRGDRGASAVEFALVMPLLLMLLFGLITTGLTFSDYQSSTNASREAARYGAATSYSSDPAAWATSVRDRVKQVYFNAGSTVTDSQICVKLINSAGTTVAGASYNGGSCGSAPGAPSAMAAGSCAVVVWMTRPQKIELIAFPAYTFDTKAQSVAYFSRTDGSCVAT